MTDSPFISVIIPVFNTERYVAEAIDSVLVQDHSPLEILVVDDGSTDGTAEILTKYGSTIRYLHQPNQGTGSARNLGVRAATGSHLAFLDADDRWPPGRLGRQLAVFAESAEVDAVFGPSRQFHSPELGEDLRRRIDIRGEVTAAPSVTAALITRDAFHSVGFFVETWVGETIDWYLRAVEVGLKMAMLPDIVYERRLHDANLGITHKHLQTQRLHALKAHLDRTRGRLGDQPPS